MRWIAIRPPLVLAAALAVAACGDSAGPAPEEEALLADLAIVAADATLEDMTLWSQPFAFAPRPAPGRPGGDVSWSGEFSGTREVTFYDADGVEQDHYDALTTALVHILHEIMGTVTREDWTASIHRLRDFEISGLEGTETHRTWNGVGSEEVSRERVLEDGTRSYEASGSFTYEDVVVPIPGSRPPYPVSGTITREMTVTVTGPNGERTRSVTIVITFDGDSTATALINGEETEIDLSTRVGHLPFRRFQR